MIKLAFSFQNRNQLVLMAGRVTLVLIVILGIHHSTAFSQPSPSPEEKRSQFIREANDNRLKRIAALTKMGETHLTAELRRESLEGIAPFNSLAYKEVVSRVRRDPSFARLLANLLISTPTPPDQSSLLGLLALRNGNPTVYRNLAPTFRVGVLIDALTRAKTFNAWGFLNLRWNEAAVALIEEKDAARPALVALLQTTGSPDAPVRGLGLPKNYENYRFRVSDYALALLNEINGTKVTLPMDLAIRNRLIDKLAKEKGFLKAVAPVNLVPPAVSGGLEVHP